MNCSALPLSQLVRKFDDEDEYVFYSLSSIINDLYNDISKARFIRFACNSKKLIIKFSNGEHESCVDEIIGTAANIGITCLYRPVKKKCGWRPLDSAATRHDVCGFKAEMFRYDILDMYEMLIYLPISSKVDKMEVGISGQSKIEFYDYPTDSIYILGDMCFESGINTSVFYLPNIISRRTGIICKNYSGNNKFDISSLTEDQLKNVKYVIVGIAVFENKTEEALSKFVKMADFFKEKTNAKIIVFKSPLIFYNNFNDAQKINSFFSDNKNCDERILYVQMKEFENQMFLYDCTLSCNFMNDYGYIRLGQILSEVINMLEVEKDVGKSEH